MAPFSLLDHRCNKVDGESGRASDAMQATSYSGYSSLSLVGAWFLMNVG